MVSAFLLRADDIRPYNKNSRCIRRGGNLPPVRVVQKHISAQCARNENTARVDVPHGRCCLKGIVIKLRGFLRNRPRRPKLCHRCC